jgi:hypothetical protein
MPCRGEVNHALNVGDLGRIDNTIKPSDQHPSNGMLLRHRRSGYHGLGNHRRGLAAHDRLQEPEAREGDDQCCRDQLAQ